MKSRSGMMSALLGLTLASSLAFGQNTEAPLLSAVRCQQISSNDIAAPQFGVENFDKKTQAFILCSTAEGETGPDEFFAGTVSLVDSTKLSLAAFVNWNANPSGSDLFVTTDEGNHPVLSFDPTVLPLDVTAVDALLGYAHSRPVTQHICTTQPNPTTQCTTQQVEECKIVYGRKECKMVNKEVCTSVDHPTQVCRDDTVIGYYRAIDQLDGYVTAQESSYCKNGLVERQSKTVYGRVFNERRCCHSDVVNGTLTNVCTAWEAY